MYPTLMRLGKQLINFRSISCEVCCGKVATRCDDFALSARGRIKTFVDGDNHRPLLGASKTSKPQTWHFLTAGCDLRHIERTRH